MCFKEEPLKSVPYFWTAVFEKSFKYCVMYACFGLHCCAEDSVTFQGGKEKSKITDNVLNNP